MDCSSRERLEADHILPAILFPELIFEPRNHITRCRTCNAKRGTTYTQAEYDQVMAAVAERKQRTARIYAHQAVTRSDPVP